MTHLLFALGTITIIVIAFSSLWLIIEWFIHRDMTKDCTKHWGYGSYKDFIREFNKYNWSNEDWGAYSLWDRTNNCKYHASIFDFNGIGMVMRTPFDFLMVVLFIRAYWNRQYPKYDWSKKGDIK